MAQHFEADLSGVPDFDITPYGIHTRIPCIRDPTRKGCLLAILFAFDTSTDTHLCLVLHRVHSTDHKRPLYRIGSGKLFDDRLLTIEVMPDSQLIPAPQWEDLYIRNDPPRSEQMELLMNHDITSTPFFIPPAVVKTFLQTSGVYKYVRGYLPNDLHTGLWSGFPPATLRLKTVGSPFGAFSPYREAPDVDIYLGICRVSQTRSERAPRPTCWAAVQKGAIHNDFHDCSTDHIDDWPDHTRSWEIPGAIITTSPQPTRITLAFAPSRINANAYVLARIETESSAVR